MKRVIEITLSFCCGIIGLAVWYHIGGLVVTNLDEINLTFINVLFYYALPIQIVATMFFYFSLWVYHRSQKQ